MLPAAPIQQLVDQLALSGPDLATMAMGWARAAPVVTIVPAFGLRAVPAPVRALLGICMAAVIAPALRGDPTLVAHGWLLAIGASLLQGIPIAIAAAVPLWAATMAGGVMDAVRGSADLVSMPSVEGRPTLLGVPMALLASAIFLSTGGPARVVAALAWAPPIDSAQAPLIRVAFDITSGIDIALAIAAPVLAASIVVEIGTALVARSASPAQVHALLAPLRSIAVLAVVALTFDRMVRFLAIAVRAKP